MPQANRWYAVEAPHEAPMTSEAREFRCRPPEHCAASWRVRGRSPRLNNGASAAPICNQMSCTPTRSTGKDAAMGASHESQARSDDAGGRGPKRRTRLHANAASKNKRMSLRDCPGSDEFGRCRPKVAKNWPDFGKHRPNLAEICQFGPRIAPNWPDYIQIRPQISHIRPHLARTWPKWARHRPFLARH